MSRDAGIAETAAFRFQARAQRIAAAPADDVDHPAHRIGAIDRRSRSTHEFDAFDVVQVQGGEIIGTTAGVGGIVGLDPIQQHQGEIGLGAAGEQRHHAAAPAGLLHKCAGKVAQQIHHTAGIAGLDSLRVDDGNIAAGLFAGKPGGGDDDVFRCGLGDVRQVKKNRPAKKIAGNSV